MQTEPDLELPPAPEGHASPTSRTVAIVGLSLLLTLEVFLLPILALVVVFWVSADRSFVLALAPWAVAFSITIVMLVQVARRRWRPATALIAVVAALAGMAAIPVEAKIAPHVCSPERRSALLVVRPYAGTPVVLSGMGEPCGYSLSTPDSLKRVTGYYRRELADAGWQVGPLRVHRQPNAGTAIGMAHVFIEIGATRDGQQLTLEASRSTETTNLQLLAW